MHGRKMGSVGQVEITNPDKVLFPDEGYTKGDLVEYYQRIAGVMLPHLKGRPLTMIRYPNGIRGGHFFQKSASKHFPKWVRREKVETQNGPIEMLICDDAATLVFLANLACITPHIWLSRFDMPCYPDKMVFDLDPSRRDFGAVCQAAQILRQFLEEELGLVTFVMTTGSKGLHIAVPLDRRWEFDRVREFADRVGETLARRHPDILTVETRKTKRKGRVFLDWLRNSYGQTSVAPYAVRSIPGAPVATPLEWGEVGDSGFNLQRYNMRNVFELLEKRPDPWRRMWDSVCGLGEADERLGRLCSPSAR